MSERIEKSNKVKIEELEVKVKVLALAFIFLVIKGVIEGFI